MVSLLIISVILLIVVSILRIHYTTNNVNDVSVAWGVITFIIYIIKGGWMVALIGSLVSFVVLWLFFSLSNYLENNLILRVFMLVLSVGAMLLVFSYFWLLAK